MVYNAEYRYRLSAVVSFAAAVVALWLAFFLPEYVNQMAALIAGLIFLADAYVKYTNDVNLRPYTTALYSFAWAALIFAGFQFVGQPWSNLFALLWVFDGILKLPGIDTNWEGKFRHVLSALNTTLLGLTLLFSVRVLGSTFLSVLLGWVVLYDAYVKWSYIRERYRWFS